MPEGMVSRGTDGELIHVYPLFGRAHDLSLECWCQPIADTLEPSVIVHEVEQ